MWLFLSLSSLGIRYCKMSLILLSMYSFFLPCDWEFRCNSEERWWSKVPLFFLFQLMIQMFSPLTSVFRVDLCYQLEKITVYYQLAMLFSLAWINKLCQLYFYTFFQWDCQAHLFCAVFIHLLLLMLLFIEIVF